MLDEIIGYIGGILIMISFVPQVIKSRKTRSVKDLSSWMIFATFVGSIFWVVYGILIWNMPVLIMNYVLLLIITYQAYLKIKYQSSFSNHQSPSSKHLPPN